MKMILETTDKHLMQKLIELVYTCKPVKPGSSTLQIIPDEIEALRQYRLGPDEYLAGGTNDVRRQASEPDCGGFE